MRIDTAIQQAINVSQSEQIVIATTGGITGIAPLVEEVVLIHAEKGVAVDLIEVADGSKAHPPARDFAVPRRSVPEPVESYRARRHALELIERGNFVAAWGAVSHLHKDKVERSWTQVVEWLALFATSLPLPSECDLRVLTDPKMAVRAALHVEFALRCGDFPRAIYGTVAFFEAALWDHLRFRITGERRVIDGLKEYDIYQLDPAPNHTFIRPTTNTHLTWKDRARPFQIADTTNGGPWFRIFDDDKCAFRLAKELLSNDDLCKLSKAVTRIRPLRDAIVHKLPSPKLIGQARVRMQDANLWSKNDRLLTQPLVQSVLKGLGQANPEPLPEKLIETVRTRLLAYPGATDGS